MDMPSGILVEVKMRPYLEDYVIDFYEGDPVARIVKATTTNKIFPLLFPFLTNIPSNYRPFQDPCIKFELPWNTLIDIKSKNYIHPDHFWEIQGYFYGIFFVDFINYMNEAYYNQDMQIKTAIVHYCLLNNMSFDKANYDSLKRIFLRYRFNEKHKKLSIKSGRK